MHSYIHACIHTYIHTYSYYRYDNEPDARNVVCTELWEQDEEAFINAMIEGGDVETKVSTYVEMCV